jgi:hypothetical protein
MRHCPTPNPSPEGEGLQKESSRLGLGMIQQPRHRSIIHAAPLPDSRGRLFPIVGTRHSACCWSAAIPVALIGNKIEEKMQAIRIMRCHYFFTRGRVSPPYGLLLT